MKTFKLTLLVLFVVCVFCNFMLNAQNIEKIVFSAAASTNNNFQPIVGTPYSVSFTGAYGSLEISSEYGDSTFQETSLTTKEYIIHKYIRVYPNPTTYMIIIDLSLLNGEQQTLSLINLSGKLIWSKISTQNIEQLDMTFFATGTYLLNIKSNNNKIESFKIIKK